jgi:DNA-binding NarL/FixJ family response regulator
VTLTARRLRVDAVTDDDAVRVLIADDNALFSSALRAILEPEPGVVVVGQAATGTRLSSSPASCARMSSSWTMPVQDGFVATERIRAEVPGTEVVVLTGSADDGDVERALAAGAAGYVTKDRIAAELVKAVRSAARK